MPEWKSGSSFREAMVQAQAVPGWMAVDELEWLSETASKCHTIIEVGSWKGRSSKAIAMSTPGRLFCVDSWAWHGPEPRDIFHCFLEHMAPEIQKGKVFALRTDNMTGAKALKCILGEQSVDMIFIDATHTYEGLREDIQAYLPLLAPGGILCGHDFAPGLEKAIRENVPGVERRVNTIWEALLSPM